jgi:hypothetical protein
MYCMALKVYTCAEAASGPKTFLNIFCKLLQQKRTFPCLTVVLIPISTHPIVQHFRERAGGILGAIFGSNNREWENLVLNQCFVGQ